MGNIIRAEVSENNPYWIEKHRYYELKHFCLQYPIWKRNYVSLDGLSSRSTNYVAVIANSTVCDPTAKIGMLKSYFSKRMDMIEKTAERTDTELAEYILKGVTEGWSYDIIKARLEIPCCKDTYYKEYRSRVVERFGDDVDKELRYNIKAKKIEETIKDPESGKEKKSKTTVNVAAPTVDDYARFFDKTCRHYEENMNYNLMLLRSQQQLANDKLVADGFLFLSDVYDMLGITRTKMSQSVGWIYKPDGNSNGDNFVDFGVMVVKRETEDGGYEDAILMNFNVDGPILDLI